MHAEGSGFSISTAGLSSIHKTIHRQPDPRRIACRCPVPWIPWIVHTSLEAFQQLVHPDRDGERRRNMLTHNAVIEPSSRALTITPNLVGRIQVPE